MHQQPPSISWVRYASYWYYSLGMLVKIALLPYDDDHAMRDELKVYSFSDMSLVANAAIMLLYGVALRVLSYFCLRFSKKLRFS